MDNAYRQDLVSVLGLNISRPPPNDPPLPTLFVLCMWSGVTEVIIRAKFHLNWFSSFGSPRGRKSPFPIGLENGSYNSYALTCYTVMCYVHLISSLYRSNRLGVGR